MIPERYYLIATAPGRDKPLCVIPLLPPSAEQLDTPHAYVANDAEALSLARLVYVDMVQHAPAQVATLYMHGADCFAVYAAPSAIVPKLEGADVGVHLVDFDEIDVNDLRRVCDVSGVGVCHLPDAQAERVGAGGYDPHNPSIGQDPSAAALYFAQAQDGHLVLYGRLRGAYQDRFQEIVDGTVAELASWTVKTNCWFSDNPELAAAAAAAAGDSAAQMARMLGLPVSTPELPLIVEYMTAADDYMSRAVILDGRIEAILAFKDAPLFVQDMLGGDQFTDDDWAKLLEGGGS